MLTLDKKINIASGEITLNGMRYNKQLRRRMGYVHQEDALMTRLTLYETLYFTAMIRIPELVTFDEKQKRIQNVVESLDIQKCFHTGRYLVCTNI